MVSTKLVALWPFSMTFWMTEHHFRSHFSTFQINTQFIFLEIFSRRPFWMTENHFRSHFSPFQINTQFFLNYLFQNRRRRLFWMTENHFRSHFSPFQTNTQLFIFFRMAASGHFGSPICAKNNRVLPLCVINGYAKYDKVRDATIKLLEHFYTKWLNLVFSIDAKNHRALVIWDLNGYGEYEFNWCILWQSYGLYTRWRRRRRRRNQKHNITEIFKFRGYNYNLLCRPTLFSVGVNNHNAISSFLHTYFRITTFIVSLALNSCLLVNYSSTMFFCSFLTSC